MKTSQGNQEQVHEEWDPNSQMQISNNSDPKQRGLDAEADIRKLHPKTKKKN